MQTVLLKKTIALTTLFILLGGQSVSAKKMYRWVDSNGNTFYSDQIPPNQAKHRRESLNKNARVIEVVEKEKTKAQHALEKRLVLLRKQQELIIKKQKAQDKVLLSTFRTIADIKLTLRGKMLAMDSKRNAIQSNLKRLQGQLQEQQKKAAQYERDDKKVPGYLVKKISSSKGQIEITYVEISNQFEKKKVIGEKFESDIRRFNFLTQSNVESKDLSQKTAENKAEKELGLFLCDSKIQCDNAWESARKFVNTYSTTPLDIETDKLILGQEPYTDSDLSLSISKMSVNNNKQQLFLDIRCRQSSVGLELCRGSKAKNIRRSFQHYIESTLGKQTVSSD